MTGHTVPYWFQACMTIARQRVQRSMFASRGPAASKSGDGKISGEAPGCSSGVPGVWLTPLTSSPPLSGCSRVLVDPANPFTPAVRLAKHGLDLGVSVALLRPGAEPAVVALADR